MLVYKNLIYYVSISTTTTLLKRWPDLPVLTKLHFPNVLGQTQNNNSSLTPNTKYIIHYYRWNVRIIVYKNISILTSVFQQQQQ